MRGTTRWIVTVIRHWDQDFCHVALAASGAVLNSTSFVESLGEEEQWGIDGVEDGDVWVGDAGICALNDAFPHHHHYLQLQLSPTWRKGVTAIVT